MRRLLSFASSRVFWVFLGLLGISLLIWFFGGIVAIGDYIPLERRLVRAAIIALIFIFWLGRIILRKYIQAQRNKELVEEIKISQEPILKHVKKDSPLSLQFEEIDSVLKSAKFSNSDGFIKNKFFTGQYLYQMPWYVVLGAAGTGKTTVLRESGLNFPLESSFGASIGGLAGTKDCDWFLTDDAVLLDTAGRLSLQLNSEEDSYDWLEFVSLLKKYRPRQPINGVVVTIGLDDILNADTDFKTLTKELRKRIHEMRAKLNISFPVYLVITKLDILKGFEDFFAGLTEEQRQKYLGFTIPADDTDDDDNGMATIGYVARQLEDIRDNIESAYLTIIDGVEKQAKKDAIFTFSNEFSLLNERLILLFRELYKSSKFEDSIQWRGIFFTSAYQDGMNVDLVFDNLVGDFNLTPKYIADPNARASTSKSYFIHDLFTDIIFKDANLASSNKVWSRKNQILRWAGIGAITGIGALATIFMFNSFLTNSQYLQNVEESAASLDDELKAVPETRDLLQAVQMADKIRALPKTTPFMQIDGPPLKHRMGLYQGYAVDEIAYAAYKRALSERVMPLISYKLDDLLRRSPDDASIDSYNALKAYLMLYDKTKFDADFMLSWLMQSFEEDSSIQNAEQKERISQSLQLILKEDGLTPSLPLDTQLIDERRQYIAQNDLSIMILNNTFSEIAKGGNKITAVSFDTMSGKQGRLVFTRASGKPLTETINPIYTKQAYIEFVLPELLKSTAKLYEEEEWVLGNYSSVKTNEADTLEEAKNAYFQRYIATWNKYLSDVRLKQPKSLREARDVARILSDTSKSPLKNLISGIGENTTLDLSKQLEGSDNQAVNNTLDRLISRAGLGNLRSKAGFVKDNYIDNLKFTTPVDEEFEEFRVLAEKDGSSEPAINEVTTSIKDLYEFLDILGIAVEKGTELPSNDSLFNYRAEVNRLPSPFRQMFDQFSVFILDQSLEELNERLAEMDLEAQEKEAKEKQEKQDEKDEAKKEKQEEKDAQEKKEEEQTLAQELAQADLKKKQELEALNTLQGKLAPITELCNSSTDMKYPFSKDSNENVTLANFNKLFGSDGQYRSFMQLDPNITTLTQKPNFNELLKLNADFAAEFSKVRNVTPIAQKYFQKEAGALGFDFEVRIINIDPKIERLIFNYDGKSHSYSHGPLDTFKVTWPQKGSKKVDFSAFINEKKVGKVEGEGAWGIFKLIEEGNVMINNNSKSVVKYIIDGKEVIVEYSAKTNNNPFYLADVRKFSCP